MNGLLEIVDAAGSVFLEVTWIPILVWTLAGLFMLVGLKLFQRIHIQYHYHLRLSILMSLPIGLFLAFVIHPASGLFSSIDSTETILKFITVQPPIDLAITFAAQDELLVSLNSWKRLMFSVMAGGSFLMACWYLLQYCRLCRLTRSLNLTPIDLVDSVTVKNKELAESTGKFVFLTFLNKPVVPVTYCIKHPIIILPASLTSDLEKMNLVLRHELMHVRNRDYRTHVYMVIVRVLFWFHPLVYHLYYQLMEYREMCCDNHVLSDASISRRHYASVLFELLPMPKINGEIAFHMGHPSSRLKKRIILICDSNIRRLPLRSGLIIFCLFLTATAFVMASTEIKKEPLLEVVESSVSRSQFSQAISDVLEEIRVKLNGNNAPVEPPGYVVNTSDTPAYHEPELIGGMESLQLSIKYPRRAARAGIDGPVRVKFDINREGAVENARVVRGIGGGADEEALRAVSQARFTPASQFGQPVKVTYTLNIYFRLTTQQENPDPPEIQA